MTDEWADVRLDSVFEVDNSKLGQHEAEPRVLSLSKYDGFVPADEYFGKRIASAQLDGYKIVAPDGWAYSTIHIDEGSIARNTLGFPGVISPMYTTLRWVSREHEPAYFALLLKSPALLACYRDAAQGSINRRRSLPFKAFGGLTVTVPAISAQRRIVDLMTHLDNHIANLRTERASARQLMMSAGRAPHRTNEWPLKPLGEVARLYQPTTLSKADIRAGGPYVVFGANGPIGTHTEFNHAESQVAVTCRGATCGAVNWTPPNCWITGNAMVVCGDETVIRRRFAYWALQYVVDVSATISGSAQPQITRTSLAPLLFPVPSTEEQDEYVATLDRMADVEQALTDELEALTRLRGQVLSSLLSGKAHVSDAYDSFLSEVS